MCKIVNEKFGQPIFQPQGCGECIYLGKYVTMRLESLDLYCCDDGKGESFTARYGNKSQDFFVLTRIGTAKIESMYRCAKKRLEESNLTKLAIMAENIRTFRLDFVCGTGPKSGGQAEQYYLLALNALEEAQRFMALAALQKE